MKYKILAGLVLAAALLALSGKLFSMQAISLDALPNGDGMLKRKIIVFKSEVSDNSIRENLIKKFGGTKLKDLNLISGKVALLSPRMEKLLKEQKEVLRIDDDVIVEALVRQTRIRPTSTPRPTATPTPIPTQTLPWGIDRVNAPQVWASTSADLVKVGVIDTGIDTKHPDLKDNIKGGVSAVAYTSSYTDDNGHGTHVAGIIAATDNSFGVVGVGPQIDLYSVKVLDKRGSGYLSDVIEGLDWAIANHMQVVNMSLGTTSDVQSFHDAVIRANAAGIVQIAAAGNSGGTVGFPASYPEVIAVSATDNTDIIASWSSRGSEVDLAAPGVNIYSTYKGSKYQSLSGTSMASPHVAGAAALVLSVPNKCDLDNNGTCSPAEVLQRLEVTARDLGTSGKDDLYGYGLIDTEKAVIQ